MYFDVSRKLEPPNLIGLMKMQLDMRARRDVFPRHRRCRNRVNLIWLALGIQNATNISVPFILAKLSRLMLLTYMGIVG